MLLITSRDTGRWIIPEGNVSAGTAPAKAAEEEAYEESGIRGTISGSIPFGFYTDFKDSGIGGGEHPATVEVYLQRVKQQKRERTAVLGVS